MQKHFCQGNSSANHNHVCITRCRHHYVWKKKKKKTNSRQSKFALKLTGPALCYVTQQIHSL